MKWQQRMADFGLTEETVSVGLRKKIKDFRKIESGVDQLKQYLSQDNLSDEDRANYQSDLDELEGSLQAFDKELTRAVEIFDKNKDVYKRTSKHLVAKKKQVKTDDNKTPAPTPEPTPEPKPDTVKAEPIVEGDKDGDGKKKSNGGWLIFAIAVGIITLGAVNVMRNND